MEDDEPLQSHTCEDQEEDVDEEKKVREEEEANS